MGYILKFGFYNPPISQDVGEAERNAANLNYATLGYFSDKTLYHWIARIDVEWDTSGDGQPEDITFRWYNVDTGELLKSDYKGPISGKLYAKASSSISQHKTGMIDRAGNYRVRVGVPGYGVPDTFFTIKEAEIVIPLPVPSFSIPKLNITQTGTILPFSVEYDFRIDNNTLGTGTTTVDTKLSVLDSAGSIIVAHHWPGQAIANQSYFVQVFTKEYAVLPAGKYSARLEVRKQYTTENYAEKTVDNAFSVTEAVPPVVPEEKLTGFWEDIKDTLTSVTKIFDVPLLNTITLAIEKVYSEITQNPITEKVATGFLTWLPGVTAYYKLMYGKNLKGEPEAFGTTDDYLDLASVLIWAISLGYAANIIPKISGKLGSAKVMTLADKMVVKKATPAQVEMLLKTDNYGHVLEAMRADPAAYAKMVAYWSPETQAMVMAGLAKQHPQTAYILLSRALVKAAELKGIAGFWALVTHWAKTAVVVMSATTLVEFLYEETLQARGMGIWVAISNKQWDIAYDALVEARAFLEHVTFVYKIVGLLSPYTYDVFNRYAEATAAQYDIYEQVILRKVGVIPDPSIDGKVFDKGAFKSFLLTHTVPEISDLIVEALIEVGEEPTEEEKWELIYAEQEARREEARIEAEAYWARINAEIEAAKLAAREEEKAYWDEIYLKTEADREKRRLEEEAYWKLVNEQTIDAQKKKLEEAEAYWAKLRAEEAARNEQKRADEEAYWQKVREEAIAAEQRRKKEEEVYWESVREADIERKAREREEEEAYWAQIRAEQEAREAEKITYYPTYIPDYTTYVPSNLLDPLTMAYSGVPFVSAVPYIPAAKEPTAKRSLVLNIETNGFDPLENRILSIGLQDSLSPDEAPTVLLAVRETDMLNSLFNIIKDGKYTELIGYGLSFDYRFILIKAMKYSIDCKEFFDCDLYDLEQAVAQGKFAFVYFPQKALKLSDTADFFWGYPKAFTDLEMMKYYASGDYDKVVEFTSSQITRILLLYYLFRKVSESPITSFSSGIESGNALSKGLPPAESKSLLTIPEVSSSNVLSWKCNQCMAEWSDLQLGGSTMCPICGNVLRQI